MVEVTGEGVTSANQTEGKRCCSLRAEGERDWEKVVGEGGTAPAPEDRRSTIGERLTAAAPGGNAPGGQARGGEVATGSRRWT